MRENTEMTFRDRLYGEKAQELFQPIVPKITHISSLVVNEAKEKFSIPKYIDGKHLDVRWIASDAVRACAGLLDGDINKHHISISYGFPVSIYKDAILFPQMCTRHFSDAKYDELFNILDYGCGRKNILPAGTSHESTKIDFFIYSLVWIYLHEQSHLFQCHWQFLKNASASDDGEFNYFIEDAEFSLFLQQDVSERDAWLRHCLELAADYEAANLTFQYLLFKESGVLRVKALWILIAGLTCLFHKFYGNRRDYHNGNAIGTHPDPSFRMRNIFASIMALLENEHVQRYFETGAEPDLYNNAMFHAFNVANMYMKIAHFDDNSFPEFMTRFSDRGDEFRKYTSGINILWRDLREQILRMHFGWRDVSIMPELHFVEQPA